MRLIIFALTFLEMHDLDPFLLGEPLHRRGEGARHRRHQRGRGDLRSTMPLEEGHHATARLQARLIEVEILIVA
ncbi:hypothetical protein [Thiorhodococcus minor]|uniref:hypothetical protein n=1 Tax=Thiorhodococcus minor TaxID=57489 RepID=UPI0013DA7323|nr:hypothetical protein [Thiorhodococcus minor]